HRGEKQVGTRRPMVRAAPRRLPRAVGQRPHRDVRPGDARRDVRPRHCLGAPTRRPDRTATQRLRRGLRRDTATGTGTDRRVALVPDVRFRHATADDAAAMARLHTQSWRENYRGVYSDAFLDDEALADRVAV